MSSRSNRTVFVRRARAPSHLIPPAALSALLAVGGCTGFTDAINPVEWYRSTVELFTGEKKEEKAAKPREGQQEPRVRADRGKPPPGADKPFPSLSSVPERPPAVAEGPVAEGLVADPGRPRYSPPIRRQAEAPLPQTGAVAAAQPPPPAIPAVPAPPAPAPRAAVPPPPAPRPAAPSVAALPPPRPTPAVPAPAARADESLRQRLMAGLEPGGPVAGLAPANALMPGSAELPPTVVISSEGVETAGAETVRTYVFPARPQPAPAPPAAAPAARPPSPPPAGAAVKVATILFPNGSAELDERDRRILAQVVQLHRQQGGKIRVVGHASHRTRAMDPGQHNAVNHGISVQRADAVVRELVRLGARSESVSTFALADASPIYYEFMPTGEAGNRRAEVFIEG